MLKSTLLRLVRVFDKSAYKCLGCAKIKRGIAEFVPFHHGWVCSERCSVAVRGSSEVV